MRSTQTMMRSAETVPYGDPSINDSDAWFDKTLLRIVLGRTAYHTYRFLLELGFRTDGRVQIGLKSLRGKLERCWISQKREICLIGISTLERALAKLRQFGLLVSGAKTVNGYRLRQVVGRCTKRSQLVELPTRVTDWIRIRFDGAGNRRSEGWVRDGCAKYAAVTEHIGGSDAPNRGVGDPPVELAEVLSSRDTTYGDDRDAASRALKNDDDTQRAEIEPVTSNEDQKQDLLEKIPVAPAQQVEDYIDLPMPTVRLGADNTDLLLRSWRAAVQRVTGEECTEYLSGKISRRLWANLRNAATAFHQHRLPPHLFCAAYMMRLQMQAKAEGKDFRVPRPEQCFSINVINKNRHVARAAGTKFKATQGNLRYLKLVNYHTVVRRILHKLAEDPAVTAAEMKIAFDTHFPWGTFESRYDSAIMEIRRQTQKRRTDDMKNMRLGKWVWQ